MDPSRGISAINSLDTLRRDDRTHSDLWIRPTWRERQAIITFAVMATVVAIFLGLRLYFRLKLIGRLFVDDILLVLAVFFYYCQQSVSISQMLTGCDYYTNYNPSKEACITYFKLFFVFDLLDYATPFTRISICILLLRVFITRTVKIATYILIFLSAITLPLLYAAILGPCPKVSDFWYNQKACNFRITEICFDTYLGISLLSEVGIFILPFTQILRLNMNRRRKYGLVALFSLGILSILADISRAVVRRAHFTNDSPGASYYRICFALSGALSIVVACACAFKPLIDRVVHLWSHISPGHTPIEHDEIGIVTTGGMRQKNGKNDDPGDSFAIALDSGLDHGGSGRSRSRSPVSRDS